MPTTSPDHETLDLPPSPESGTVETPKTPEQQAFDETDDLIQEVLDYDGPQNDIELREEIEGIQQKFDISQQSPELVVGLSESDTAKLSARMKEEVDAAKQKYSEHWRRVYKTVRMLGTYLEKLRFDFLSRAQKVATETGQKSDAERIQRITTFMTNPETEIGIEYSKVDEMIQSVVDDIMRKENEFPKNRKGLIKNTGAVTYMQRRVDAALVLTESRRATDEVNVRNESASDEYVRASYASSDLKKQMKWVRWMESLLTGEEIKYP